MVVYNDELNKKLEDLGGMQPAFERRFDNLESRLEQVMPES